MTVVINGTTGITNDGGYTGDGVVFADTTPANTLVTTTGGNVGIGTSSPVSPSGFAKVVQVSDASSSTVVVGGGGVTAEFGCASGGGWLSANGANPLRIATNGAERARIDSSGNLLVGTTNAGVGVATGFRVVGVSSNADRAELGSTASTNAVIGWSMYSTGAGAYRFYVGYGGTVYATSTTITGISDQRLKENIRDLDDGLEKLMALQPRKFDWKNGKGKGVANDRGFIAQEFEQVFPDMIEQWQDPAPEGEEPYKAVNANLIPTLVKAIQEQQAIITALTARVATLEGTQP